MAPESLSWPRTVEMQTQVYNKLAKSDEHPVRIRAKPAREELREKGVVPLDTKPKKGPSPALFLG